MYDPKFSAARLIAARKAAHISQRRLAKITGVSENALKHIERGQTISPRLDTAAKLAHAIGCKLEDFLEVPE